MPVRSCGTMVLNHSRTSSSSSSSSTSSGGRNGNLKSSHSASTDASASLPPTSSKSKFSFDKFFFGNKRKQKKLEQPEEVPAGSASGSSVFMLKSSQTSSSGSHMSSPRGNAKMSYRPPPIATSDVHKNNPKLIKVHNLASSNAPTTPSVRLCQSPGGRSNMQLAIPITPPSAMLKAKKQQKKLVQEEGFRASSIYGRFTSANTFAAFSLGPWRESSSSSSSSRGTKASGETSIQDFLASLPIDLAVDVRTVCQPESISLARKHVHHLLQCSIFEIRSTKWAAYFLQIVKKARNLRQITSGDAISLRWVIWCCVRKEVNTRQLKKEAHDQQMQKKMTDYRVALQCIRGTTVLKYGRKGKPHQTQLMIENGESLFWTSKLLSHASKKKSVPLASIVAIRAGPTTDVLARALQKGMLALQDAKCTLSLITATRTFDIKAKSTAEREWLHRSFSFLVDLAHEHEKRVAQQVELSIMKRMETLNVWKHGRKGRPHKTRIFINRFGEISWQGRSGDSIQIDEILAIDLGHCTQVFSRSLSSGFATSHTANYCFSLVTRTRTLDIETSSENMRDWFVVAFRYLMDKVKEKTAALKREKAEKQLKLLQELCGSIGILNNAPSSAAPPAAHA